MNLKTKVEQLRKLLKEIGYNGSSYRIAKLLGISQSTVNRWVNDQTEKLKSPHMKHAIEMLERVLVRARDGSKQASETLFGMFSNKNDILKKVEAAIEIFGSEWLFGEQKKAVPRDRPTRKDAKKKRSQ